MQAAVGRVGASGVGAETGRGDGSSVGDGKVEDATFGWIEALTRFSWMHVAEAVLSGPLGGRMTGACATADEFLGDRLA